MNNEKNTTNSFSLPTGNAHGLKQFKTEYVAVFLDNCFSIYNVLALCKVRNVKFQGMFQRAILVQPDGDQFLGGDKFV